MERCSVTPYEGDLPYCFISYSHKDTAEVVPMLERLAAEGYRIWYDEGIDPGSEWPENIADHLSHAAACIGLISKNYLDSPNCRRELNFALKKQIPFLSVMLEEVQMPLGVEMQLSANQAIFKNKLLSDDAFYRKLNATRILQPARVTERPASTESSAEEETPADERPIPPAEEAPPAPAEQTPVLAEEAPPAEEDTPAADISAPEEPSPSAAPPSPAAGKEAPAARQEATPEGKKKPPKKGLKIGLIVAAVLLAAVVALAIAANHNKNVKNTPPATTKSQTASSDNATQTASSDAATTKEALLKSPYAGRVLWGIKTQTTYETADQFVKSSSYMDVSLDGVTTNLSALPYTVEVRAYEHPDVLRLTYLDQLGTEHIVEGSFVLKNESLHVAPCEKTYDDARSLDGSLDYGVALHYGALRLSAKTESSKKTVDYHSQIDALSGAAEAGVIKEIAGIDIPKPATGESCTIRFQDGGYAADASIETFYDNICSLSVNWSQENRLYNGVMGDFSVSGNLHFYYINTYPCGFILIDNEDVYLYQDPLPDEKNGPADEETPATVAEATSG